MSQPASTVIETSQALFDNAPLPTGWQWVRLGELCIGSGQYGTSEKANGNQSTGTPVLGMSNIFEGRLRWDKVRFINLPPAELDKYRLDKGDVLFNRTNSAELVGKTAVFDGSRDAVFASYLIRLRINEATANPDFIAAYINSEGGRRFIEANMARAIGQVNISASTLMTMPVPIAPLAQQHRITAILKEQMAAVERARAAAEAQLNSAKDLPAAYLRAVFNGAEAKGWQVVKVGDITSLIIDGPHVTPMYVPKGVPFVTVRNIVNRRIDLSQVSYITESDHAEFSRRGKAEKGDILYTKDGTLGIPCVVDTDDEFSFFVSVALIKLIRERADSRFVAYALESPLVLKQVELLGAGAGLKHMVLRSIRALEIPLPSIPEQRNIAAALNEQMLNAEQAKKILKDQLASINKLPAALLRQAFTGKL